MTAVWIWCITLYTHQALRNYTGTKEHHTVLKESWASYCFQNSINYSGLQWVLEIFKFLLHVDTIVSHHYTLLLQVTSSNTSPRCSSRLRSGDWLGHWSALNLFSCWKSTFKLLFAVRSKQGHKAAWVHRFIQFDTSAALVDPWDQLIVSSGPEWDPIKIFFTFSFDVMWLSTIVSGYLSSSTSLAVLPWPLSPQ